MAARRQDSAPVQAYDAATRTVVSTLGVLLGISSINHGWFEMMQGNTPTPGFLVKALGPGHSWTLWADGSEPAFTLLHNFLLTGTLATAMGFAQDLEARAMDARSRPHDLQRLTVHHD